MRRSLPPGYLLIQKEFFRLASPLRKLAAFAIDLAIVLALFIDAGSFPVIVAVLLGLAGFSYLQFGRGFLRGQRVGDRLLGIIALDAVHGVPCTPFQCLLAPGSGARHNPLSFIVLILQAAQGDHSRPTPIVTVLKRPVPLEELPREPEPVALRPVDLGAIRESIRRNVNLRD
jgi:hypothetical protein